ncbi:hypothetical protein ACMA1I_10705 [Pontibacter sp. 13R65]|uniref:hypothetical protein n=1 Tax=Pontibacter sp. 13R65 TaxID=3127458 RepID=UPI00301C9DDF
MHAPQLPKPVLFHPLKHHLGYIREFIGRGAAASAAEQQAALQTIGSSQLDFYLGQLSARQLAEEVVTLLEEQQVLEPAPYQVFLQQTSAGYRLLTLSDSSDWVLRWGLEEGRHVHLHPARYATHTIRLKANTLKTAIVLAIYRQKHGTTAFTLNLVNQLRQEWLGLPPIKAFEATEGTGAAALLNLVQPMEPG